MAGRSMQEVIDSGELMRFMDPRLLKALRHPFREHALARFNEGIASGTEIGRELGIDVSGFYHHIEELERLGCIELVDTRPRRGGKEHFFRAKSTVFFDDGHWPSVPGSMKEDMASSMLQSIFDEAVEAAKKSTLNAASDEHVSWTPGRFDDQAWSEVADLLNETLARLVAILGKSAERLAEREERGTPATIALLGFKTDVPGSAD